MYIGISTHVVRPAFSAHHPCFPNRAQSKPTLKEERNTRSIIPAARTHLTRYYGLISVPFTYPSWLTSDKHTLDFTVKGIRPQ
eukprot:scaffold1624_cov97-Skeletonema_marinoi.AAC.2